MKQINPFRENLYEIIHRLIDSSLTGAFIFLGAFSVGSINKNTIILALISSFSVALMKFKDYWEKESLEYSNGKKKKRNGYK